ncbi:Hypothetical predicted protein [Cloeon dipterum]|uniref:C2H2-type domain-containing protein n=1 Tax=Cloeon dipterum TaxID=197152 RepID=A0A8S1E4Z6_9INSE|nr:Hypothetical predicted protein [Cloeon dipterum]
MSFQKALCLVCERPTADGAVLAVHVDKEKLQTWFLNVCEYEMDQEIYDDDLICYFCTWDAEFLWKFDRMADEALVWWPARNSDHLDDAAKELRKNYFEGKLEQCWVQLEKIELQNSEREENVSPIEAKIRSRSNECIYCRKNIEEKEEHTKKIHESSRQREKVECSFCGKEFEGSICYKQHVRHVHKQFLLSNGRSSRQNDAIGVLDIGQKGPEILFIFINSIEKIAVRVHLQ